MFVVMLLEACNIDSKDVTHLFQRVFIFGICRHHKVVRIVHLLSLRGRGSLSLTGKSPNLPLMWHSRHLTEPLPKAAS